MELPPKDLHPQLPERPLECSECRRSIAVHYTEIEDNMCTHIGMCRECPQLQRRLKGTSTEEKAIVLGQGITGLVCGECRTTLDNFLVSRTLGCSTCYEIFEDFVLEEMLKSNKISPSITKGKLSIPLHIGRASGETQEINPSLRLIALNKTLEETLKREDYEQAAWLRDQIKAITEGTEQNNASEK